MRVSCASLHFIAAPPVLLQVLYNFEGELHRWLPRKKNKYNSPLVPAKIFLADGKNVSSACTCKGASFLPFKHDPHMKVH